MSDFDKRVEEAAKNNARVISSTDDKGVLQYIDDPDMVQAFIAGAQWAKEEIGTLDKLISDNGEICELYDQVEALRQQCEAMAKALELTREYVAIEVRASLYSNKNIQANQEIINEALTSYQKFREGGGSDENP